MPIDVRADAMKSRGARLPGAIHGRMARAAVPLIAFVSALLAQAVLSHLGRRLPEPMATAIFVMLCVGVGVSAVGVISMAAMEMLSGQR
jgi:uncharacterized membrane protein YoaK (UPF0700 family)